LKELRDILNAVAALAGDERAILATVIDVRGSGYRLPGARMLMTAGGETYGTVSGGCLEADVLERAKRVLSTGRAEVFTYDTTEDENSVFSMNMGCRGVIRILLEAVGKDSPLIGKLRAAQETRTRPQIATLIAATLPPGTSIGGRAFLHGPEIEFENLTAFVADNSDFRDTFLRFSASDSTYAVETFEIPEGTFEISFETIEPPLSLLLFGAGADAVPMARIVSDVGWEVTVFDHRPAFLTPERFPAAKKLVLQAPDETPGKIEADTRTAAVVMTHNYARDRFILPALLESEVFYIGALGPKKRTEQLLAEATVAGINFTAEQIARLYAPVGLDIGAATPEGIALSIISEIQSVLAGRDGGHLREREGSIYDRK
jgi:xanthine/CO dehydrogenase XdhC/CoxF family maturation factor